MDRDGVAKGEAIRRLKQEEVIGKFIARIREQSPDIFGGAWLDSGPERFNVVLTFAGDPPPGVKGLDTVGVVRPN